MRKLFCVLLMVLLALNSTVFAAGNQYMLRKSDQIAPQEISDMAQRTQEEIQKRQEQTPEEAAANINHEPQVFTLFGWFTPKDSTSQTSTNAIITGGETRALLGTPNSDKTLETIKVYTKSNDLLFKYTAKLSGQDWQEEQTGTYDLAQGAGNLDAESKKIVNLKFRLDGVLALDYDVYYRAYLAGKGWGPWASNNAPICPEESGDTFESLDVRVLPKDASVPLDNVDMQNVPLIVSTFHEQDVGTVTTAIGKNVTLGHEALSHRLEGFTLSTDNPNVVISYQSYIEGIGWQDSRTNNGFSGTEGEGRQIEAVKLRLEGSEASNYDVFYRAYIENYGWLDWANNDMIAGTVNQGLRLEALRICLLPKGSPLPGNAEVPSVVASNTREGRFLEIINSQRLQRGLLPLTGDSKLSEAAQIRLDELEEQYNHVRPNGEGFNTVIKEVEYRQDGLEPALGECFSKTKSVNKALTNFETRKICKSLLLTDFYRYAAVVAEPLDTEESPELMTVLLSDSPSDYHLLY